LILLTDRTNDRAYAAVLRPSVVCIVAKRCNPVALYFRVQSAFIPHTAHGTSDTIEQDTLMTLCCCESWTDVRVPVVTVFLNQSIQRHCNLFTNVTRKRRTDFHWTEL